MFDIFKLGEGCISLPIKIEEVSEDLAKYLFPRVTLAIVLLGDRASHCLHVEAKFPCWGLGTQVEVGDSLGKRDRRGKPICHLTKLDYHEMARRVILILTPVVWLWHEIGFNTMKSFERFKICLNHARTFFMSDGLK